MNSKTFAANLRAELARRNLLEFSVPERGIGFTFTRSGVEAAISGTLDVSVDDVKDFSVALGIPESRLVVSREDLERWREETLDNLGHRTNQIADLDDALHFFESGEYTEDGDVISEPGDVDRLVRSIKQILEGRGPLSSWSRADLEAKAAAARSRGENHLMAAAVLRG